MIKDWRKASTAWSSSKSRTSSIETELTRPSLFLLLLFFLRVCLNLEDALSAFFLRDPILVLLSSSEFSKSDLLSFFSSLPENPSKPAKIQNQSINQSNHKIVVSQQLRKRDSQGLAKRSRGPDIVVAMINCETNT